LAVAPAALRPGDHAGLGGAGQHNGHRGDLHRYVELPAAFAHGPVGFGLLAGLPWRAEVWIDVEPIGQGARHLGQPASRGQGGGGQGLAPLPEPLKVIDADRGGGQWGFGHGGKRSAFSDQRSAMGKLTAES
jgi:hypothetical protein